MVNLPRFGLPEDDRWYGDDAPTARLSGLDLDVAWSGEDTSTTLVSREAPRVAAMRPRQFVLALPESMVQQLAASQPRFEAAPSTPSQPWTVDAMGMEPTRRFRLADLRAPGVLGRAGMNLLLVLAAAVLVGTLTAAGATELAHGVGDTAPVGIALHAPKTLHKNVRARERIAGASLRLDAVTVSVDSLARARRRRR